MRVSLFSAMEAVTLILAILVGSSAFLFNRRGFATRKTVVVSYIVFLLFVLSLWVTGVIYRPSVALTGALCLGGGTLLASPYWILTYLALPRIQRTVDKTLER